MTDTLQYPPNEEKRLKALKRYQILDTPPDGNFDHLTKLAATLFNMPIAIISLIDEDRIWFKSHEGLEINQIDREPGLCASAIISDGLYIVENATDDPRTLANPLVAGEFGLKFYAAAPLTTSDGYNLGTFCLIDKRQRYLTESQKDVLQKLAEIAMNEMELRLSARTLLTSTYALIQKTTAALEDADEEKYNDLLKESRNLMISINKKLNN